MEQLALNIKYLRAVNNLTQSKVEESIGLKRGNLHAYESGRNIPPLPVAVELATFFQVSIDELINLDLSVVDKVEEPEVKYLTKQHLYNFHELVEKVHELDAIVRKLQRTLKI